MHKSKIIYHLFNAAIFILLEIAALGMLKNSGSLQDTWFSKGMHTVSAAVWGGSQNISNYFSLRKKNDSLALENHELRVRVAKLESMVADSAGLGRAGLKDGIAGGYRYTPANIVKISNNTRHNYIIIDKGSEEGISNGSGIITGKGAIGVVDAVGKNFSYARSFKNHGMSISARLGRNGAIGPLSWNGRSSNGAVLTEIPHHVAIDPGDTIYTSGFSSIFPPDIPLGTAMDAKIVNGGTYEIEVKLFEDFGMLRHVTIVENLGKSEIKNLEEQQ